jgi:hypothetical protein
MKNQIRLKINGEEKIFYPATDAEIMVGEMSARKAVNNPNDWGIYVYILKLIARIYELKKQIINIRGY